MAEFILPRLVHLKEVHHCLFWDKNEKETSAIFDKMIYAFNEITLTDHYNALWWDKKSSSRRDRDVDAGLQLFTKYFLSLWD